MWSFIYGEDSYISGYNKSQMMWYVIMTELVWMSTLSAFIRREVSVDVKTGKIAYMINKPYNYNLYVLAKHMGESFSSYSINVLMAIAIGLFLAGPLAGFALWQLPFIFIIFMGGLVVSSLFYILLALTSFWVEENTPFVWIYEKLVLVFGVIFPIEVYPLWAQKIIGLSPIYTCFYAPAKITVDFSLGQFFAFLSMQIGYVIVLGFIVSLVYGKGVKKLNVNGG